MKRFFVFLIFFFALKVYSVQLSPIARVSLITVTPGDQLYNAFGHSAILIWDDSTRIKRVYNYGTFDFGDDPLAFYVDFTRGKLKYMLAIESPNDILGNANYEKRSLIEQRLNLTQSQKQRLFDFLENNALPENCFYKYDFFYDNCSSRIRDVLIKICGDSLAWDLPASNSLSFRALIDPYLDNQRYQDMGMDLGMGSPADVIATPAQMMFLPDYLKSFVGKAKVLRNGKLENLVSEEITILQHPPFPNDPFWKKPGLLMGGILVITLVLTFFHYKRASDGQWFNITLFSIAGLISFLLIFLWFFTDHGVTKYNLHLVWANPVLFIFIYWIVTKKNSKFSRGVFLTYFFATFLLLIFWTQWTQELNGYLAPLALALSVRALYVYYRLDKKTENHA